MCLLGAPDLERQNLIPKKSASSISFYSRCKDWTHIVLAYSHEIILADTDCAHGLDVR